MSHELCDQLLADFAASLDVMPWGTDELGYRDNFYGSNTKRLHGLFGRSAHMAHVLTHPTFIELARRQFVHSGMADDIRLSNAELMVLAPGQGNQTLHQDAASWRYIQQRSEREILLSANCALTDFTSDNGATRVVAGSHRWPLERKAEADEVAQATMPKGAALIYTGNTVHSGGANDSADLRTGLYLGYIPSWLRPLENQLITNEAAAIQALPEAARRLLDVVDGGFTVYA